MNKLADHFLDTLGPQFVGPDPLELEVDVLRQRIATLEDQFKQMALNNLKLIQRMAALQAQSTSPQQSAIIMPDRFN